MRKWYNDGMENKGIIDYFDGIETEKEYTGYFCSIGEAVSIAVLGSLCGLKNVRQIHQWASSARTSELLKEKFGIKHIPCYYWLLVLLKMVKPEALNNCIKEWAEQYLPEDRKATTISLDGKTIRSTTGMKKIGSPLHVISAQLSELGITLASKTTNEKSNEIPTVQELIGELDIEGCMVVADALNCQQETAKAIIQGKGDYLLDAKDNQKTLKKEIEDYVGDSQLRKDMESEKVTEKNRDRMETRTAYVTSEISWLYGREKWEKLSCIGAIKTEFEKSGQKTTEWHYYISSRVLTPQELLHHARMEWAVETMHWCLDVHFAEDYFRVENKTIQQNFNMLRKFALSIVKIYKSSSRSNRPMSNIMFDCLLDPTRLTKLLASCSLGEN